jgi:hypothetical protein
MSVALAIILVGAPAIASLPEFAPPCIFEIASCMALDATFPILPTPSKDDGVFGKIDCVFADRDFTDGSFMAMESRVKNGIDTMMHLSKVNIFLIFSDLRA